MIRTLLVALLCIVTISASALAGIKSKAAREAAEYVFERFGVEVGEETVETLTQKIGQYGAKYGDEAVDAIRKTGPQAFKLIDDAGENGSAVVRRLNTHGNEAIWIASKPGNLAIFVKHGDEAAVAMIKHPGVAGPVIDKFGAPAARAIQGLSGQNARRIAMMADEGELAAAGQASGLLDVIARYGDRAADFIWKNKGALAVAVVAVTFINDPEPILDGVVDLGTGAVKSVVQPIAEEAARSINWNLFIIIGALVLSVLVVLRFGWHWLLPRRITNRGAPSSREGTERSR